MAFSYSSWQDCLDTGRSTGEYIIFYQGGPIDHDTHVPGPVAQYSVESEYNAACTSGMALAYFRMSINELLNKDPKIFPEEAPLIVLDSKSVMCMANNGKDTKHTRHNRWELLGNYPVFIVVMVIYHYVERIWKILVTPNCLYNRYNSE